MQTTEGTRTADRELVATVETEDQCAKRLLASPYLQALRESAERRCIEAGRQAADLWYANYKASGQLRRDEDWRALVAQVQFGTGLQ